MKPTAPDLMMAIVFATDPARWLISFSLDGKRRASRAIAPSGLFR